MAYVISDESVCQIIMEGRQEGQQVMTVLTYRVALAADNPNGAGLLSSLLSQINALDGVMDKWSSCQSASVHSYRLRGQWIYTDRFAYLDVVPLVEQGQVAGDAFPVNVAVALTRRTQNSGRDQVGTVHMPGVPLSFLEDGNVTASAKLIYESFGAAAQLTITVGDDDAVFTPIHYHRISPSVGTAIINTVVQPTARVMRRRTVGLGS